MLRAGVELDTDHMFTSTKPTGVTSQPIVDARKRCAKETAGVDLSDCDGLTVVIVRMHLL